MILDLESAVESKPFPVNELSIQLSDQSLRLIIVVVWRHTLLMHLKYFLRKSYVQH